MGQLTLDINSDVCCLQTFLTRRNEDLQMTFGFGRHTTLIVNILFCFKRWMGQLTLDINSDVCCLQTFLTRRNEDLQMTFGVGRHTTLIVNILFKIRFFSIMGRKNNQSSVFDADREISILGSTDNAGNSVNRISGFIRFPSGWDFSVCIGHR